MAPREYHLQRDRKEPKVTVDWTISISHIVSFLGMIGAILIAYEKLEARTSANDNSITDLKSGVSALNNTLTETNLAVRELKTVVQIEGRKTRDNQDSK